MSTVKYHVFRNYTVEPLFEGFSCSFSAYDDVSEVSSGAEEDIFFYCVPVFAEARAAALEVLSFCDKLKMVRKSIGDNKILSVFTLTPIRNFSWEERDCQLENAIHEFNVCAHTLACATPNTRFLNIDCFLASLENAGSARHSFFDCRYYYTYQTPFSPHLAGAFSAWFRERIEKMAFCRKKLLVLDLDGTLWSGVVGEGDACIGGAYPGNAFFDIQRMIAAVKNTGTLLAIVSKNNFRDVEEFFLNRPDMPLSLGDFVHVCCNWEKKSDNIKDLTQKLGIGLESVVVLDDSPFEREEIRGAIPSVVVPELPAQPYDLVPAVASLVRKYFATYTATADDINKTEQYEHKKQIEELRSGLSHDDFLQSLNMKAILSPLDEHSRGRFLQLTQKTNQFNLTTLRLTDAGLAERERQGQEGFVLKLSDRFGNHGIIGCALLSYGSTREHANVEALLLSCRVLGRGVEFAFLGELLNQFFNKGVRSVSGAYLRTAKNAVAENFFERMGFELSESFPEGRKYTLALRGVCKTPEHVCFVGGGSG
jgi:FkbH-like protein